MANLGQDVLAVLDDFLPLNRGFRYEGEVFDAIWNVIDVIRAFEFALVDGAIDISGHLAPTSPQRFADRFWDLEEQRRLNAAHGIQLVGDPGSFQGSVCETKLTRYKQVLFDVKSRVATAAEDQIYITTLQQRVKATFYIGLCSADPTFVEIYPNTLAGTALDPIDDPRRHVAVNSSRKSRLLPSDYGFLSPCNSPYRMPMSLLSTALQRIGDCARERTLYTNPWTNVTFPKWKPYVVQTSRYMVPDGEVQSQHCTSYSGTMAIYRAVRNARNVYNVPIDFDFIRLAPRLADFKLIVSSLQFFVQYKIDGRVDRPQRSRLEHVGIGRGSESMRHWYFTPYEQ